MIDREKVIGHLNDCMEASRRDNTWVFVRKDIVEDAIDLLKEQKAVEPKVSSTEQRCGNCNKVIEMDGWIACPWCGKPIAWNEWWNKNGGQAVKWNG